MIQKFSAVIEKDDHGCFAYCPELKGCHSQGDSIEEALANLREAMLLYLETLTPEEIQEHASRDILTTWLEVAV